MFQCFLKLQAPYWLHEVKAIPHKDSAADAQ